MEAEVLLALVATVNRFVELVKRFIPDDSLPTEFRRLLLLVTQVLASIVVVATANANILDGTAAPAWLGIITTGLIVSTGSEGIHVFLDLIRRLSYKPEPTPDPEPEEPIETPVTPEPVG